MFRKGETKVEETREGVINNIRGGEDIVRGSESGTDTMRKRNPSECVTLPYLVVETHLTERSYRTVATTSLCHLSYDQNDKGEPGYIRRNQRDTVVVSSQQVQSLNPQRVYERGKSNLARDSTPIKWRVF